MVPLFKLFVICLQEILFQFIRFLLLHLFLFLVRLYLDFLLVILFLVRIFLNHLRVFLVWPLFFEILPVLMLSVLFLLVLRRYMIPLKLFFFPPLTPSLSSNPKKSTVLKLQKSKK